MHVPMSVVECLLRVYHYHTSIYRLEGKLRVRSFISLLEKNGGFQKMTWEFLWKTFFDFMTSIGRSGVASKRFLYEWHMRNNSNWFLGRRSFVPQTPFFCNDCYRTYIHRSWIWRYKIFWTRNKEIHLNFALLMSLVNETL